LSLKLTRRLCLWLQDVRLPPAKVIPPSSSSSSTTSSTSTPTPRSPLSPYTPTSPLFPDGLIAPIWVRKHTYVRVLSCELFSPSLLLVELTLQLHLLQRPRTLRLRSLPPALGGHRRGDQQDQGR